MKKIAITMIALLLAPLSAFAALSCQEGQDYTLVPQRDSTNAQDKITVVEFFNPGCPACNFVEPQIEGFEQSIADSPDVSFTRIPVVFRNNAQWNAYAKAFYLAQSHGIEDQVMPALFDAIHKDRKNVSSVNSMVSFFEPYGVDEAAVKGAFNRSPTMDVKLQDGNKAFSDYRLNGIPSVVVNDQFITTLSQARTGENMVSTINCLVDKVRQDRQQQQ